MNTEFEQFAKAYQDELGKAHIAVTLSEARVAAKPIFEKLQGDYNYTLLQNMMFKLKDLVSNAERARQRFFALGTDSAAAMKQKAQVQQKALYVEQEKKTKQLVKEYVEKTVKEEITKLSVATRSTAIPAIVVTGRADNKRSKTILISSAAAQNRREHMEDTMIVNYALTLSGEKDRYNFFAIFDGHAGQKAAGFLQKNFVPRLQKVVANASMAENNSSLDVFLPTMLKHTLKQLIEEWDFTEFDDGSGSTAIMMLIDRKHGFACFLNLGDSKAVLYDSKSAAVLHQTQDHDLDRKTAVDAVLKRKHLLTGVACRVTKAPGDVPRINDNIAMFASFGDNTQSTAGCMSRDPDCYTFNIKEKPTIAVLGSDGLWDEFSVKEVGRMAVNSKLNAAQMVERGIKKGKIGDNITVILVDICPQIYL
jgi:serine/threonine protein phosphatase PrpC